MSPFALALARTLPLAWLGLPIVPAFARLLIGLLLAATVTAGASPPPGAPLPLLLLRELGVGVALGLVASIPLRAAEGAGELVDAARDPHRRDPLRRLFLLFGLAVFGFAGGPRLWIEALGQSYAALPVGHAPGAGATVGIEAVQRLVAAAIELATPALAALLTADLAAAVIARAAPRLGGAPGDARSARQLASLGAVALSAAALSRALDAGVLSLGASLTDATSTLAR